jgi:hypothetical protein
LLQRGTAANVWWLGLAAKRSANPGFKGHIAWAEAMPERVVVQYPCRSFIKVQAVSEFMFSVSQMLLPKLEFHDKRTPKGPSDRAMKRL